jgi:hypothetical protein
MVLRRVGRGHRHSSPSRLIPSLHINQLPGSEDDTNGYNEAGRNVAIFEVGGDSIGRWDKDDLVIVHHFGILVYNRTELARCPFHDQLPRSLCYIPTDLR